MPKYFASCGFNVEFRVAVSVQQVIKNQSKSDNWIGEYLANSDDCFKESYAEWLVEEAVRQAGNMLRQSLVVRGDDPSGVVISEFGLDALEINENVSDWRNFYEGTHDGEIDQFFIIPLAVTAFSSATILSLNDGSADDLYRQADSFADEISIRLKSMIRLHGELPPSWTMKDDFEIEVDSVDVHERKTMWEKKLDEYGQDITHHVLRPSERTNYRQR